MAALSHSSHQRNDEFYYLSSNTSVNVSVALHA